MSKSMPSFTVLKNKVAVGTVSAVSYAQAIARAHGRFGRCEVVADGNVPMDRKGKMNVAEGFTHGRAPYATPGFEERRAALIAAHKAGE
jgi:hypothetical protein